MRTLIAALAVGLVVFGLIFLVTAGRQSREPRAQAAPAYVQQDRGEGGVEIEVTYVTPDYLRAGGASAQRYSPDKYTVFLVSMNTHSVDLAGYEMAKISELRVAGRTYAPLRWESTSDNNHHRSGALIFPKVDVSQPAELVIKTIAGVPQRLYRWQP